MRGHETARGRDGTVPAPWYRRRPATRTVALLALYDADNNGIRQLAPALRRRGFRTLEIYLKDWRNNRLDEPTPRELRNLVSVLRNEGVALVGVSLRASPYQEVAERICRWIRSELDLPIVLGGWHVTVRPDACIAFADAICRGEGDASFPAFVEAFFGGRESRLLRTPGFWVRGEGGQIHRSPIAPLCGDLDSLPWRDFTHPDKWWIRGRAVHRGDPQRPDPRFVVIASVGCPNRCSFCHHSFDLGVGGPAVRTRSVSDVIGEVQAHRRHANPRTRRVRFDDAIFGQDPVWLEEFADRWPREVGLPVELMTEPQWVTPAYAELLQRAGADIVEIGIQSVDSVNEARFCRPSSREQNLEVVRLLSDRGIELRYLVIVDIPGITDEDQRALFQFFQDVPPRYDLFLFSLTLFPGCSWVEEKLASGEIDPSEVEGQAKKTFRQFRVDLAYPRPDADAWWLALMVLDASHLVPRRVLRRIVRTRRFRDRPAPLVRAARCAGLAKTARIAARLARRGEVTPALLRRWLNVDSWITQ